MDDRDLDGEAPHLAKGAALGLLYAQQHGYDFRYVPPRLRAWCERALYFSELALYFSVFSVNFAKYSGSYRKG